MRLLNKIAILIYFLIAILLSPNTFAKTAVESWNLAIITGSLSKDKKLKYYIEPILDFEADRYKFRSSDLYLGFGYQVTPTNIVWLMNGMHYILHPDGTFEKLDTIRQQVNSVIIPNPALSLNSLFRLEERKDLAYPQWAFRARERLILRKQLSSWQNHSLVGFEEMIFNFNNPKWTNCNTFFSQNRVFLGVGTQLSKYVEFDLGYLNQYSLRTTGNEINSIIYLVFNVTLD